MIVAVVPAAGKGTRMGGEGPKLALRLDGVPLIVRVIEAFRGGGVELVVVVVGPASSPGSAELAALAASAGAVVEVAPADPPDMRASVVLGLERLRRDAVEFAAWLLSPGDSPGIDAAVVRHVVARGRAAPPGTILVPTCGNRRGHPVWFPPEIAGEILALPPDRGVNAVVAHDPSRVIEVDVGSHRVDLDLDTPEDVRRWISSRL